MTHMVAGAGWGPLGRQWDRHHSDVSGHDLKLLLLVLKDPKPRDQERLVSWSVWEGLGSTLICHALLLSKRLIASLERYV